MYIFDTLMPYTRMIPLTLASKRTSSLILVASLLAAPSAWAVAQCELNGKPINTNNGNETAGKSGMVLCKDADTGQTEREYELRDGKSFGLTRYFQDGKLSFEFTSTANGPHVGLERRWAANGQLVLEFTNVDGNTRGLRRTWYDNGQPKQVEFVAATQRDGAAVEFTPRQQLNNVRCGPKPLLAPHVDDAALCGFGGSANTLSTYDNEGNLRSTETLLDGVVQKATRYYGNGKPQDDEERQGTNRLRRRYDPDGTKRSEDLWSLAQQPPLLLRNAQYHASGPLTVERLYTLVTVDGRQRSQLKTESSYYLNGQPRTKDHYRVETNAGRYRRPLVSLQEHFFDNGQLAQENTFDEQGNIHRRRVWDEAGQLLSDDELFEDGSRKAYAR